MEIKQLLLILRARYKIALFVFLCTVGLTLAANTYLPRQYIATSSVLVDIRSPDPIATLIVPASLATQMDVIKSDRVAQKVVKILKLDQSAQAKKEWEADTHGKGSVVAWLADLLGNKLSVKLSPESNIINISYKSVDPAFAAAVANAYTQAYVETNIELKAEPSKQYAHWFEDQGKALREILEKAQRKLSDYQQAHGILVSDEKLDSETAKLNDLTAQLAVVQGQTADARSKERAGSELLPEVSQNPLIQNLQADLARKEAHLQELAVNLGTNHPQYRQAESEIAALKQKLNAEMRRITSSFAATTHVSKEKQAELAAAVQAQKQKLLELKNERDQLAVLQRDVDAAKNAYDTVTARYNETNLASQTTQTNISVLVPAVEPTAPSFPNTRKNTLMSIVVGLVLGAVVAVMFELIDRRIRSVEELNEMLQLPVLGIIQRSKKRRRLPFWRRGILGWAAR